MPPRQSRLYELLSLSAVLSTLPVPDLTFSAMCEDDLARVAAIEADVYVFPWTIGNFRESLLSAYQCWACRSGDELIGYAIVLTALDEAHLPHHLYIDDALRAYAGREELLNVRPDDHHFNEAGHDLIAAALAKYIEDYRLMPPEPARDPHD